MMVTKKKTDMKKTSDTERDDDVFEQLRDENPEALLADGFESAYLGVCRRYGQPPLAAYDRARCIEILVERDGMDWEGADEFFDYNVLGAWVGDGTPVYLDLVEREDASAEASSCFDESRPLGERLREAADLADPAWLDQFLHQAAREVEATETLAEEVNALKEEVARAEVARLREVVAGNAAIARSSVGPAAVAREQALEDAARRCEDVGRRVSALGGAERRMAEACARAIRAMIGGEG